MTRAPQATEARTTPTIRVKALRQIGGLDAAADHGHDDDFSAALDLGRRLSFSWI
jgi:hypothetical protein